MKRTITRWIDSRLRRVLVAGLESGAAAGLAWLAARELLGSETPIYAPVAAVVVIGAGYARRLKRVHAMLTGMGIAIIVSEVGTRLIGNGAAQLGLLTAIAVIVTQLSFDDRLAVAYAGLNAAVLVGLGGEGWVPSRFLEAAIGASTAYGLIYLVIPPRPAEWVRDAMADQVSTARENLRIVAEALKSADTDTAVDAEERSEQIDRNVESLSETFDFSYEVTRFSPWRRQEKSEAVRLIRRTDELQTVLRNSTTVVRTAGRLASNNDSSEWALAEAVESQSAAIAIMGRLVSGEDDPDLVEEQLKEVQRLSSEAIRLGDEIARSGDGPRIAVVEALRGLHEDIQSWADVMKGAPHELTVG